MTLATLSAGGCRRSAPPSPAADLATASATPIRARTTDGELAAHNFEAELALADRQWNARPSDLTRARNFVDHLLAHAQFFGTLGDYDRAQTVAERVVALAPRSGDAHLLHARVEAALHRFPRALSDLDAAERLKADPELVLQGRVGIWEATGEVDRALVYLHGWRRDRPDLPHYAAEAAALADKGETTRAAASYAEALRHYSDVSPFAVAWVEFQTGHMWESAGRADLAQPFFESAVQRLPTYASAAGHLAHVLAAFGDPAGLARAETLLSTIVQRSDDPEYVGQLGVLQKQLGHRAEGDRLVLAARASYQSLLRRHPEAFYDHAARFYLHVAGDPATARELAEKNLALRNTAEARALLDEAQRATQALSAAAGPPASQP